MNQFTFSSKHSVFTFSVNKIKVLVLSNETTRYTLNQVVDAVCVMHKTSEYADEHGDIGAQFYIDENRVDRTRLTIERIRLDASFDESLKIKKGSLGYRILSNQISAPENDELMQKLNGFLSILRLYLSIENIPLELDFGSLNLGILSKISTIDSQLHGMSADYFDYEFDDRLKFVVRCLNEGVDKEKITIYIYECFDLNQNIYEKLKSLNSYVLVICRAASDSFPIQEYYFSTERESIDFANDLLIRRKIMESNNCMSVTDLLRYFLNK